MNPAHLLCTISHLHHNHHCNLEHHHINIVLKCSFRLMDIWMAHKDDRHLKKIFDLHLNIYATHKWQLNWMEIIVEWFYNQQEHLVKKHNLGSHKFKCIYVVCLFMPILSVTLKELVLDSILQLPVFLQYFK